jgi:SPP1 gp7 family putative phage head morphogenesis protein
VIGDERGGDYGGWSDPDWKDVVSDVWDTIVDTVGDVLDAVWTWVTEIVEIVRWVRAIVMELYGVTMERWETHGDERTCPECAGRNGAIFEADSGESPPAHTNCRCRRVYAYTDWRTRPVVVWQREVETVVTGSWQVTGWA